MTSERKLWWLRLVEKMLVVWILSLVSAGVWLSTINPDMPPGVTTWGVIVLVVSLLGLLITQVVVDKFLDSAIALAGESDDARFRSLYERSPHALVTIDARGAILKFNPAAVKLLAATTDSLKDFNFFDFVLAHTGHDESFLASKIDAGITLNEEELLLKTKAEEEIWVLMSAYEDTQKKHHIISLIDVTQSKKVDAAKTEFVALATHQLRTPIAAIRWNFELLHKKLPSEVSVGLERYLTKVERNIFRMISLIDDFLSVSKLEMGTFATSESEIHMSDFLTGVLDEYAEKIAEKQITVARAEDPQGYMYRADSRLLHISVSNLVSNAVKYCKAGGKLEVGYQLEGRRLILRVTDDGIGIPRSELPQLFKRFFRASNARSHQTEGTGLGLYIVKQSVDQMGGEVTVSSVENMGSVFTVSLPTR